MPLAWNIVRVLLSAAIIVTVSEISQRFPRAGALLLSLPLVSLLAFILSWQQHHDLASISQLAKDTLVLVPLGLVFFVPLAYADKLGLGFWPAFLIGVVLDVLVIGAWLWRTTA